MKKLTAAISAALLLSPLSAFAENTLVIDAGSSGSRLYDYQYHYDTERNGFPTIDSSDSTKVSGGIQDVSSTDLDAYLTELFANVSGSPERIDFYSTAGMRLISAPQRDETNASVKSWIETRYPAATVSVKTISGQTEGAYAWLAANYLNGALESESETKGIMDLGGASTQITFEQDGPDSITVNSGNHSYQLSSTSFLGMGQDQALGQFMNDPYCFPEGYTLPNGELGNGGFDGCVEHTNKLIQKVHGVKSKVGLKMPVQDFYSIAGFYYTAGELNLTDNFSIANLAVEGKKFCKSDWNSLTDGSAGYAVNDYLYTYCFNAAYQYTLLSRGYQMTDANNAIAPTKKINDQSISWTLGPILSPTL